MKVFFKELKEIKAIVKSKELRAKGIEQREKAQSGKSKDKKQSTQKKSVVSNNSVIPACRQAGVVAKKGRKMKFRPEITRVKLNPEQAVLTCTCYLGHGHANTTEWSGAYPLGEIPRYCQGKELVHSFTGGVSNSPYRFVWVSGINGAGSS